MLLLDEAARNQVWKDLIAAIEDYIQQVHTLPVSPPLEPENIRKFVQSFDFSQPLKPSEAIAKVVDGMRKYQVHTPHPMYYGLFNPAPSTMSIAGDSLVAALNPQMAAWSHNPFASEAENYLIREFGVRFGYSQDQADGTFCSGGAEANHTAVLTALVHAFPEFAREGVRALSAQPVFYVSAQSHHSFLKAARFSGIGTNAVREVPVNENLKMNPSKLNELITKDRKEGFSPFMIVATAGTTSTGIIDDLAALREIAVEQKLWLHTDAAWGGAAILLPEGKKVLNGIGHSDSVTFDAHKWLSVPMGAGMYLTRNPEILSETCRITTDYMPKEGAGLDFVDPYSHSMQWSRRFIGLKLFLTLACSGWKGYEDTIRHQWKLGDALRNKLTENQWKVVNDTPLPTVCFIDALKPNGNNPDWINSVLQRVLASGKAWISMIRMPDETAALRACITNYRTTEKDVAALVELLNDCRK
jgi:glutamate/tyrosine decarboxylase-like PLP-dependent enzyme